MKIFNWVHRRFNNHKDDELAKDAKRSDHEISVDIDQTQFVVKNYNNFSVWKGGILTIGTFGYDPLKNEESHDEDDHDDDDEEHIMVDSYSVHQQGVSSDKENSSSTVESEIEQIIGDSDHDEKYDEMKPLIMHAAAAYGHEDLLKMEQVINDKVDVPKKERTTLAELFNADQSEEQKKGNKNKIIVMIDVEKMSKMKENSCDKNRMSSAANKKSGRQDTTTTARPMGKRLHRLVRRMLKTKIHPEPGLNSNKHIDPASKRAAEDTREFDSLLPIQDAGI